MKYVLLERKVRRYKGKKIFFEKWVEPRSKSGIVFYSNVKPKGSIYYVVEGYGIGTIDPKTFSEIPGVGCAPIQRSEYKSLAEAREGLAKLMKSNIEVATG